MRQPVNSTDIANAAKVSTMTVSRFFNSPDKLSAETYARIAEAVERFGYVQNHTAKAFFRGESRTVGLVVPNITNPFVTTVVRGAEDAAQAAGYMIFIGNSDGDSEKEHTYVSNLLGRRVDGMLVIPAESGSRALQTLALHETPTVLIDRPLGTLPFDAVRADSYDGARLLAAHLLERVVPPLVKASSRKPRIAFIGGVSGAHPTEERIRGLEDVLGPSDIRLDIACESYSEAAGIEQVHRLRAQGPLADILIAANNVVALGILKALAALGEQRLLASFDSLSEDLCGLFEPFIAVVHQDAYAIGHTACRQLLKRIDNPDTPHTEHVLPMQLGVATRGSASA